MLVLSRKVGERIRIGKDVTITVVRVTGGGVRLGIEAPTDLAVIREELLAQLEAADTNGDHVLPAELVTPRSAEVLGPGDNDA